MAEPEKRELENIWLQTWEPTLKDNAVAEKITEILNDDSLTNAEQSAKIYELIKD